MVEGAVPAALWIMPANDNALEEVYKMYSTDSQQPTMKPAKKESYR